ncbi:CGNR zinc finger domain-containing protein [Streptomyces sp. NPDC006552]|uniref:CGNR zinc finger domain-containing protein n=1 Tax=Streptomyces sp. NPDC006552 TaxID=3157179 RepID=UPI00339F5AC2
MEAMEIGAVQEEALLDLLNTTPVLNGTARDLLAGDDEARGWLAEHDVVAKGADLGALRAARDTVQKVVRGEESPRSLAEFLVGVGYLPVVDDAGIGWRLDVPAGREAAALAVLTWNHVRTAKPGRLRPCANDECRLFLLDKSKANKAKWCSMAVCGNRTKARRHYARVKGAESRAASGLSTGE